VQLIVITPDKPVANEYAIVNELFRCGLNRLHLRKPSFDQDGYINYINNVNSDFRSRIVISGCFELYHRLKLGGVHLNSHLRDSPSVWNIVSDIPTNAISTSFHSWTEITENTFPYNYVFISPVFNSISKFGYNAVIDLTAVIEARGACMAERNYCPAIIGLGGVGINELPILKKTGFDGAAMLGSIWQAKDPVAEMTKVLELIKTL
jgi:thiamine-phosphate pyrophosphorylase